jgi:selenocysteine lyase/cysteine desulfurase
VVQTPIGHKEFQGIRVTPNVYTSVDEIDRFADYVLKAIRNGLT